MSRRPAHAPLDVFMTARLVGRLAKASDGAIGFADHPSWLQRPSAFAISLSLPLRETRQTGETVDAVFENLLEARPYRPSPCVLA